ncbi:MAG: hypothetical protein AB7W59_27560 [Acidimicrobiia bacterium]
MSPPDRSDPADEYHPIFGAVRARVQAEAEALLAQLDDVDNQLADLAKQRHELASKLKAALGRLRRRTTHYARQPAPDGSCRLPPLHAEHDAIWGRRLRSTIVTLLRRAGPLKLPELHALLHHHGYRVYSTNPAKALSDACSYEVTKGRLTKPERGTYGPIGPAGPQRGYTTNHPPCGPLDHLGPALTPHAA